MGPLGFAAVADTTRTRTPRGRSPVRRLVERSASLAPLLVALLVALFVARVTVTITEFAESRVTWWGVLLTAAVGLEAWRAWTLARVGRAAAPGPPVPAQATRTTAGSGYERVLRALERRGPAVLYAVSAAYAVMYVVLVFAGTSRDALLDVAVVVREVTTLFFLAVILLARRSLREPRSGQDVVTPGRS